jgi:hypothetical protein
LKKNQWSNSNWLSKWARTPIFKNKKRISWSWEFVAPRNHGAKYENTWREFRSFILFLIWSRYYYLNYFSLIYKLLNKSGLDLRDSLELELY